MGVDMFLRNDIIFPSVQTIGKISDDDSSMIYPNPNFIKYFPKAELPG